MAMKTQVKFAEIPKSKTNQNVCLTRFGRFEALKKRTDDVTRRSTEKRIKHLQKTVLDKVQEEFVTPEDRDELRKYDVKFGPPVKDSDKGSRPKEKVEKTTSKNVVDEGRVSGESWSEVQQYLSVNAALQPQYGAGGSRSGLEQKMEKAIKCRDVSSAEKLSDTLATRNFGVKIAHAVQARDFMKRKREEEAIEKQKQKKKLKWGFEEKKRWETKSNM